MAKPPKVTTEEFVLGDSGLDPFAQNYYDSYMANVSQTIESMLDDQNAFAPPTPTVLPEVPLPFATPTPGALPPSILKELAKNFPWLAILVPGAMGPPGTGDAPYDPSTVSSRYDPPKRPPTINPTFDDPSPPNWDDLLGGGDSGLLDPLPDRLIPVPLPPVEMPDNTKFFDVEPPRVVTRPTIIEVPIGLPDFDLDFGLDPRPGPAPAPGSPTRSDPISPNLDPISDPRVGRPLPDPKSDPAPDLFGAPLPDVFGNPFGDPFTPSPQPAPPRGNPTPPEFFAPTDFAPTPTIDPILTEFGPNPTKPEKDQCSCGTKKKKKNKREPRTVCYRGTYTETKKGLIKKRLEEVPCEDTSTRKGKRSSPSTSSRKKKTKPGQFPGLALSGGQLLDYGGQIASEFLPVISDYVLRKLKTKQPPKGKKRNRKAKTKPGRAPGTIYTTPFFTGD